MIAARLAGGERLYGGLAAGYLRDIGTHENIAQSQLDWGGGV
jgi:hypothetical protein